MLYPLPLRDTLLRVAETELYDPYWSEPKDRNVIAAAVVSDAQAVVTLNLRDFPLEACQPFAIEPLHPDVFLLDLYALDADAVVEATQRQAAALSRPPMTFDELLGRLAVTVPSVAQALRAHR